MAKTILTAIIILVVLAAAVVLLNNVKVAAPSPSPSPSATATATPEETTGNIHVFSPSLHDEVGLPLVIKGEARTFERRFSYRVLDGKGAVLIQGSAMSSGQSDIGHFDPFEVSVNYPDPKTASGSVEVFSFSAKDGSEINNVIVPVVFKKDIASSMIKVYFPKIIDKLNPDETECKAVFALDRRVPKTDTPVRTALDELLRGVYKAESDKNYTTDISTGATITSVNLKAGVLTIDFASEPASSADICRSAGARAQITKTAMQFPSISKIVITVNGKTY